MFTITKEFGFEAAHQLKGLPDGHQCSRLHGHSYRVIVELRSEQLNQHGFVVDYGDLQPLGDYLKLNYDHRFLNDIFAQPTAEIIAEGLFRWCKRSWPETSRVSVSETGKTWAHFQLTGEN